MPRPPSGARPTLPRDILSCLPLFACLPPDQTDRLAVGCRTLEFAREAIIFSQDERATGMFVVLSGTVKVVRWDAEGKESVLHLVRPGNILAEAAVFQGGVFPASAVAVTAVRVLFVERETLTGLISANPELALRMLAALSLRLRMLTHKLGRSRHRDSAARRVAEWLVHRGNMGGSLHIDPGVSREVLANLLGLARETLSRTLTGLERDGLIRLEGKTVVILDPALLRRLAEL